MRRRERAIEKLDPAFKGTVRHAVGDETCNMALADRAEELNLPTHGGMLLDRLKVGNCYWVTTQTFPIVGRLVDKGIDYLEFDTAALILADGRTSQLMATGRASGVEVEPIGDGVFVAADQIGFARLWPFQPFKEAL